MESYYLGLWGELKNGENKIVFSWNETKTGIGKSYAGESHVSFVSYLRE